MNIEDIIDAHMIEVAELFGLGADDGASGAAKDGDPLPTRQILEINTVTYYSANFVASTGAAADVQNYVKLEGGPTPNSLIESGYILFVPRDRVRAPVYNTRAKSLRVWFDIAGMPQTLAQLGHSRRYLWIGWFANGHVYADLHTTP